LPVSRLYAVFVLLVMLLGTHTETGNGAQDRSAQATPAMVMGCDTEGSLAERKDVVFCEPWEDQNWWRRGYLKVASTSRPRPAGAGDVDRTAVVTEDCVSGSCLKVEMRARESGALAIHWPLRVANRAPEALYLRYYLKLAPDFDPALCTPAGQAAGNGGKFPGLADVRTWPEEQCGNGGAFGDGINCWSMRAYFRNCLAGEGTVRQACRSRTAKTRFGSYLYYFQQRAFDNGGVWDQEPWGQGYYDTPFGSCRTARDIGGCGKGSGGQLENGKWYAIEMYVKMNTPGREDGVIRGWVDGQLSYEKTNMIWRIVGHDNLHVRTIWLNVHAGGESVGLCKGSAIYLDQMVATTDAPVGLWRKGSARQ
jgi:hypothetical protein